MSEPGLDVLVLGSVTIRDDAVRVPRLLERALLARLALAGGSPVPDERLAADLWGPESLDRPVQRLRVLVSRLRSALGDGGGALTRLGGGYALRARAADLDAVNAATERLRGAARSGDHRAARSAAADALGRWRGRALDDVRGVPFAAAEGERLDALRLDLLTERIGADLELGASTLGAANELQGLVAEHPLNERLACLLAVALYRGGRQADALAAIARLRGALADELGVDPAPRTAETELRILRQDPALAPPPPLQEQVRLAPVPGPATSFVGRDEELAALTGRLASPCLVTLVGEPGVGKSRLALEAARRASGRRVTMVRLAPSQGEGAVAAALASAAGQDGELAEVIGALDGVVVLDNAEHLLDQVAGVAGALLAGGLSVLVTSQRPLLVAGEEPFRVEPLGLAAATRLFEERCAADARPEPDQVREICAAVDRLPLGVELAAGLTRTLTVGQLAERLHDRLGLLVGGARDEGGRHASMRAALDWSHDLLPEPERRVLRRAAVFRGGFELEAAEAVVDGLGGGGVVAAALTELVDRSLVAVSSGDGRRRFGLLESVRDYALAKLDAAGETEDARGRHLLWCLAHVRQAGEADDFASAEAVAAVFGEWPNLKESLENAPGTGRAADGLRLALELHTPWLIRGWYAEARRHMAALVNAPGATAAERATLLSDHGFVSTMAGELGEAAELLDRAAEQAAQADDDMLTMTVLYHRGIVEIERGRLRDAFAPLLTGEELARKARHEQRVSAFADALGTLHLYSGEPEIALERCRTAAASDLTLGDEHGLARGLSNQAQALLDLDRHAEALVKAAESDRHARRLEDVHILGLNELIRGLAARAVGDLAAAEPHLREAAASEGPGMAAVDLADVLILREALDEAGDLLTSVYAEAAEASTAWLAARTVSTALAAARGEHAWARELANETAAAHAAAGFGWRRYAVRLREVVRHLDEQGG